MEQHSIPVFTMRDNPDDLPVFIRTYGVDEVTKGLHAHQMIQINYVVSGSVTHKINRSEFIVTEGDAFVIPPQVPHGLLPMDTQSFTITELEFNPEFVWGERVPLDQMRGLFDFAYIEPFLVSEKEVKPRLNIPVKDRHMVLEALREIQHEYENRSQGFLLAIKASILRLLVRLGRLYSSEVTDSMEPDSLYNEHARSIARALSHIDAHFHEPLEIDQVAKIAILSKSYFCYLFKQLTKRTFGEYVKEKRLQYACRQLIETDEKISHIAMQSGYTTVSHFNRVFKDTVGTSPRTYRRMNFYEKR